MGKLKLPITGRQLQINTPIGPLVAKFTYRCHCTPPTTPQVAALDLQTQQLGVELLQVSVATCASLHLMAVPLPFDKRIPADLLGYWGVLGTLEAFQPLETPNLTLRWNNDDPLREWDDRSGQSYARLSFYKNGIELTIGTLDGEGLCFVAEEGVDLPSRLTKYSVPKYDPDIMPELPFIKLGKQGITLSIPNLDKGESMKLAFGIAWAPERDDAVDTILAVDLHAEHLLPELDALLKRRYIAK